MSNYSVAYTIPAIVLIVLGAFILIAGVTVWGTLLCICGGLVAGVRISKTAMDKTP
jgi:hypothetical protein